MSALKKVSSLHIIIVALIGNLLQVVPLLAHRSQGGTVLRYYSRGYAAFLGLACVILVFWLIVLIRRKNIEPLLHNTLPLMIRIVFVIIAALFVLCLPLYGVTPEISQFMAMNWAFLSLYLLLPIEDKTRSHWIWIASFILVALMMCVPIFLQSLIGLPYSPDEAIWADYASSNRVADTIVYRTGNYLPLRIAPGIGWIQALYGEVQWLVDYDLRVGRLFNLSFYALGILGLALLANRLYGAYVAFTVVLISIIGSQFLQEFDYRPHHFIVFSQSLVFFCLVSGRYVQHKIAKISWHFLTGLFVTLAMQLHAIAITYAIGISLFYLLDFLIVLIRKREQLPNTGQAIVSYGLGAVLGTGLYYSFNILPVGGLETYLSILVNERPYLGINLNYIFQWSQLDFILMLSGLAFLIWRRNDTDKLYLALILCSIVGISLADTQGYVVPYQGLFLIPIAVLINDSFPKRRLWMTAIILVAMLPQTLAWLNFSAINTVIQQGGIPEAAIEIIGQQILEEVPLNDGEVIVSTHELIWVMPDYPYLYSSGAEGLTPKQRDLTPLQVWQTLQPAVYIQLPTRLVTPPALQMYLELETFEICQEFTAFGAPVIVHRTDCSIYDTQLEN